MHISNILDYTTGTVEMWDSNHCLFNNLIGREIRIEYSSKTQNLFAPLERKHQSEHFSEGGGTSK